MRSYMRSAWAFPVAAVIVSSAFGCCHQARAATVPTPPPAAAIGGGPRTEHTDGPQRLDPARADRFVDARKEQFRNDCYSPERGTVSFVIDAAIARDGRIESATVASSNGDPDVAQCVRNRLEQVIFPRAVEGGVHTFTFLFGH